MFSMREYLKKGYLDAVGNMPDFWIILNSTGYYEKGFLLQEDLAEINAKIDEKNEQLNTDVNSSEQEEELVEEVE